jgi:hypothetical protein
MVLQFPAELMLSNARSFAEELFGTTLAHLGRDLSNSAIIRRWRDRLERDGFLSVTSYVFGTQKRLLRCPPAP